MEGNGISSVLSNKSSDNNIIDFSYTESEENALCYYTNGK